MGGETSGTRRTFSAKNESSAVARTFPVEAPTKTIQPNQFQTMYQHRYHSALLLLVLWCVVCTFSSDVTAYVSPAIKQRWKAGFAEKDATDVIEACIEEGYENEDLFCAVKYMDRFANDIYRDPAKKQSLMDKTKGSWELRLALNDDRDQSFYPHPGKLRTSICYYCFILNGFVSA